MAQTSKSKRLVIVESPAKARTIGKYLGSGYTVRASVGHIRDLPTRELGVDIDAGFEPKYVTIRGKGRVIQDLRRDAQDAEQVILATDPDREGEAIAFHVAEQLGYQPPGDGNGGTAPVDGDRFRRVLFHEITRDAVQRALEHPAALDMKKVEAQQARRILDRIVGYQVSPILWKPIRPGLSAGRVQTVALRLIAEREAEIRAFVAEEYWSITALLEAGEERFEAKLHQIDGQAFRLADEAAADQVLADVRGVPFEVTDVKRREKRKNAPPPFTTSTLQQEAAKRLGFSAKRTMRVAQQLYEGIDLGSEGAVGLITYMRTDSTRVAGSAIEAARAWVKRELGDPYLPASGRSFAGGKKQKGAQEAHEAIRPSDAARHPSQLRSFLDKDQARLYELVWLRFVASQMTPAVYDTTTIDFDIGRDGTPRYLFRATGSVMKFDGFTRLYREAREDGDHRTLDDLSPLPSVEPGAVCDLVEITPAQHFTQPPPRYSEATLVKELEKQGIGRPSTYAQIISTIQDRNYVELKQKRFHTTPLGETVAQLLIRLFPDIFDVGFTSGLETELDRIEEGELDWRRVLAEFYDPFERRLKEGEARKEEVLKDVVQAGDETCEACGRPMEVKWSRRGRFLGCSGYPDCRHTRPLDESEQPVEIGEPCPECGGDLILRQGRYGPFVACSNYPKCKHTQPWTVRGLTCPKCGEGGVAEKRTGKGKPFWGCTRYPECDWSVWDEPVAEACPQCDSSYLLLKSTKSRGEFLKCPQCKAEMDPATVGAGE